MKDTNRTGTTFLRFLAIILIINSHMDSLYPYPIFATGGAMGNSLFFMLSSFGLLMSERIKPQRFWEYYTKRILRIYPVVWTNIILLLLPLAVYYYYAVGEAGMLKYYFGDPLRTIGFFYYPPHWFLQAIMFFYLVGFFFIKDYSTGKILKAYIILGVLYVVFYLRFDDFSTLVIEQTIGFKMIFYGIVFLLGIYMADINEKIIYEGRKDFFVLFGIIFLFYFHKFLWYKGITQEYQFIEQLLILPMLYYFMKISKSPPVKHKIMAKKRLATLITVIGSMTLELYIVHGAIRPIFAHTDINFFIKITTYLISVFVISYLFYRLNTLVIDRLKRVLSCR